MATFTMVAVAALTVSCELDNVDFSNPDDNTTNSGGGSSDSEAATGYLSFSSLSLVVDLESEDFASTKSGDEINTDEYFVSITNDDPQSEQEAILMTYSQIKELGGEVELLTGTYTLSARSYETQIADLGWDKPEYASKDYSFVVSEGETSEVADDVICTLANIKASVTLTDAVLAKFKSEDLGDDDTPLTVTLQFGDVVATYSLNAEGEFTGADGDVVYFAVQDEDSSIVMTIVGMYNTAMEGEDPKYTKVEWTQEIEDVAAGQFRNITIDVASTADEGKVNLNVTIEGVVSSTDVDVDVTDGSFYDKGEADLSEGDTDGEDGEGSTEGEGGTEGGTEGEDNTDDKEEDVVTPTPGEVTCSIEWRDGYDFDTRYDISSTISLPVVIDMTSESGITTLLLEIISDVLTDEELAGINLAQKMDLINPATEQMEGALQELGFPTGDDIEGQTELVFDITSFMPMLALISPVDSETDFKVTLGDASGEVTKTIMVKVVE